MALNNLWKAGCVGGVAQLVLVGMLAGCSQQAESAMTAKAEDPPQVEKSDAEVREFCESASSLAGLIMQGRQSGMLMAKMMDDAGGNELIQRLTISAFEKPRASFKDLQQKYVDDFANDTYLECIKNMRK